MAQQMAMQQQAAQQALMQQALQQRMAANQMHFANPGYMFGPQQMTAPIPPQGAHFFGQPQWMDPAFHMGQPQMPQQFQAWQQQAGLGPQTSGAPAVDQAATVLAEQQNQPASSTGQRQSSAGSDQHSTRTRSALSTVSDADTDENAKQGEERSRASASGSNRPKSH